MKTRQTAAWIIAIALLTGGAVGIALAREARYPSSAAENRLLYVTSGALLERSALSATRCSPTSTGSAPFSTTAATGSIPCASSDDLLYPLLDLTTSLDPSFKVAYRFGAIFLPSHARRGRQPELAVALLEKGDSGDARQMGVLPDIGFVYSFHLHDYRSAAEWFRAGGEREGAPWWLPHACRGNAHARRDRQAARIMWRNMLDISDNDWLKRNAERRLMQLDALDQMDGLQRLVEQFAQRTGRRPAAWQDLGTAGLWRAIPVDPSGTPYVLDGDAGTVALSEISPIFPLPVAPPMAATPPAVVPRGPQP